MWPVCAHVRVQVRRRKFRDGVARAAFASGMAFALIAAAVRWQEGWYT